MKIIETEIDGPIPDKPGHVRKIGQRTTCEVFDEFKARLEEERFFPINIFY